MVKTSSHKGSIMDALPKLSLDFFDTSHNFIHLPMGNLVEMEQIQICRG